MEILVAEDERVSRYLLESMLKQWGYDVVPCADGQEAWQALQQENAPPLAILDWMMPRLDGVEVCRRVRQSPALRSVYLLLLTAKDRREDLLEGLRAGADDYLSKPFDREELRVRLQVGVRIVELQRSLEKRVRELEQACAQIRQLQGLLPICCYCKKIRDDQDYWQQVDLYISRHLGTQFSHGICPECFEKLVKPKLDRLQARQKSAEAPVLAETA